MEKIDKVSVVTGVINADNLAWWALEELWSESDVVDIDYEQHLQECPNDEHDLCYTNDCPEIIVGFKKNESNKYVEDESQNFSLILDNGMNIMQITNSKFALPCKLCSPCYPNQGDLDSEGDEVYAYCLPLEYFEDTPMYDRVKNQIMEVVN